MASKETILRQFKSTSNEIASKFDEVYTADLEMLAEELATSYNALLDILEKNKEQIQNNAHQSALLYWGGLNSVLALIDLLRRGYTKEPQMILRNVLEVFAVAYDIGASQEHYELFMKDPIKFPSTKSVNAAKQVHDIIGQWYGLLSDYSSHVGPLHILPHKITSGFYVGGMFDPKDQAVVRLDLMMITGTLDILNSLLELSFIRHIATPRFWVKIDEDTYKYTPNEARTERTMREMEQAIKTL